MLGNCLTVQKRSAGIGGREQLPETEAKSSADSDAAHRSAKADGEDDDFTYLMNMLNKGKK